MKRFRSSAALAFLAASSLAGCALVFGLGDVVDDVPDASLPVDGSHASDVEVPIVDAGADVDALVPETIASVHAGFDISCALTTRGALWCWGGNTAKMLGAGNAEPVCRFGRADASAPLDAALEAGGRALYECSPSPLRIAPQYAGPIRDVSLGAHAGCVVDGAGRIECFGESTHLRPRGSPSPVGCDILARDGTATCYATLGLVETGSARFERIVLSPFATEHACAWGAGGTYCWGQNRAGQANPRLNAPNVVPEPGEIAGLANPRDVVIGIWGEKRYTCALKQDGEVWCWGDTPEELNLSAAGACPRCPRYVRDPDRTDVAPIKASAIAAGVGSICALKSGVSQEGALVCWGDNRLAQKAVLGGDAGATAVRSPFAQLPITPESTLHASAFAYCVRGPNHPTYCWGSGIRKEIPIDADAQAGCPGFPASRECFLATEAPVLAGAKLGMGYWHGLGRIPDAGGSVLTWGGNVLGSLGRLPFEGQWTLDDEETRYSLHEPALVQVLPLAP